MGHLVLGGNARRVLAGLGLLLAIAIWPVSAQGPIGNDAYAFKIYHVNYAFYPAVQVYFRTFDQNRNPLVNVNVANIGVMVKGRIYDPRKLVAGSGRMQYGIETLQSRGESFRTVFVWDCSGTMAGKPFADAQTALMKFIETKRAGDQVAILAIRDEQTGYQLVSSWEKDPALLYQRIMDVKCDGKQTRLYDTIGAAMEMCATASQGDINNQGGEFTILNAIVVLSDGKDEGSAVSREELIGRINTIKTPIPVFSLAYSSVDSSNFRNLEALSKATVGQYWTASESQEFASTVQKIHQINRSDYVVTFRSYEPIDGSKINFKLGISYPANTGRFLWQEGEFEAIESPAPFNPASAAYYQALLAQYPALPTGPYTDQPQAVSSVPGSAPSDAEPVAAVTSGAPSAPPSAPAAATGEVVASAAEESQESVQEQVIAFAKANGALLGMGAVLLVVVIGIIAWVKRGTGTPAYQGNPPTAVRNPQTQSNSRTGTDPSSKTEFTGPRTPQ